MYDARERTILDREWEIDAAERRGEIKGKIEGEIKGKIEGQIDGEVRMIRMLQGLLGVVVAGEQELRELTLEQLRAKTSDFQDKLRSRIPS